MTESLADIFPAFLREIDPYQPGRPLEEVERELRIRAVKLASNENPLGPSPLAVEAAKAALAGANRYPDGGCFYLREKLSARLGMPFEQIILGNGSSELIDIAARLLLREGDEGLTSVGSFPLYSISIRAAGGRLITTPLRNYGFDLEALARAVTSRTRVIYLSNPNNPTGTLFLADELGSFLSSLRKDVLVVLDEAYFDYADRPGYSRSLEMLREGHNLLVLRTFSKVYGLAGLRLGYGMGPRALLEQMNKIRMPFNTSNVAQAAALAALDDVEHVRRSLESNRSGLAQLGEALAGLGVRFVPSAANFLFVDLAGPAAPVADKLLHAGVVVRPMAWMGFPNAMRVTVGTHEENQKFLAALAAVLSPDAEARSASPATGKGAA